MVMTLSDIQFFRSRTVTDTTANGGKMDEGAEVVSGAKYNLFPRVSYTERTNGVVRYRKEFMANRSMFGDAAYGALFCIMKPSNGGDRFAIKAGTQTDTQGELTADGWVSGGPLAAGAAAGATSVTVAFESDECSIPAGATLCIADDAGTVWLHIANDGNPTATWNGTVATIRLLEQLPRSFAAFTSFAGVCVDLGDLEATVTDVSAVTASGLFHEDQVTLDLRGVVEEQWSITMQTGGQFTVTGAEEGALQPGQIGAAYAPLNPRTGYPFFTLGAGAFTGLWGAGESVQFTTHPASGAIWWRETVPAGTAHEPSNSVTAYWFVE